MVSTSRVLYSVPNLPKYVQYILATEKSKCLDAHGYLVCGWFFSFQNFPERRSPWKENSHKFKCFLKIRMTKEIHGMQSRETMARAEQNDHTASTKTQSLTAFENVCVQTFQNLSMVLDTVAYSKSPTLDHLVQVTSERFWQLEDYHQHQRLVQGHLHNKVWFQNTFRTSNQIQSSRLMINFDANVHSHTCQRFPFPSEKRSRKVNCSCQVLWTGFLQNIITYLIFQFQRNRSRTLRTDFVNLIK